jgi:DNA-binding LytR/AlgR family response regulator
MKILIVDDEAPARARLIRMLAKVDGTQVVGEASNGPEALERIEALRPDLVFLDVDMPGLDGIAVAETAAHPAVVFVTAHARFAADAFEVDAYDYLLKPVSQDRLERAIEKVRARGGDSPAPSEPWRLSVHDGSMIRFVDARTVDRFHSTDKYTAFTSEGRELLSRDSLSALEERLASYGFVRVHRAELVRRDAIRAVEPEAGGWILHLTGGEVVRVSLRRMSEIERALGLTTE